MQFLKNEKRYSQVRLIYLVWLLLYATLRQNVTALQPVLMPGLWNVAAVAVAGVLFLWDLLCFRRVLKAKYIWILVAVFVAAVLSVIINFRYSFVDNVKAVANMFIQFFVVYTVGVGISRDQIRRELKVIGTALSLAWFIAAAASLYMYFADIYYWQTHLLWGSPVSIVQGFVRNHDGALVMRLWGVFIDPNFAAGISVAVICFGLWLLKVTKQNWLKALHIVNIVVQFLYIVLSNSRMALLLLYLAVAVCGWYYGFAALKRVKLDWLHGAVREIIAVALAIVLLCLCYLGVAATKQTLPYIRYGIAQLQAQLPADPDHSGDPDEATDPTQNTQPPVQIENLDRTDIEHKGDVSNGRFAMWQEGFRVFLKSPVLGLGPRSYRQVAAQMDPNMEIAKISIHNAYMELLMGGGAVGFLLMVLFFALCAKDAVVLRYRDPEGSCLVGPLMVAVLTCLGCGMFISALFYYLSGISILVFLLLGYAVALSQKEEVRQ